MPAQATPFRRRRRLARRRVAHLRVARPESSKGVGGSEARLARPSKTQGVPPPVFHGGDMRSALAVRRLAGCVVAAAGLALPGCSDGHLNLLGYTTEPSYDCTIQTVYVPIPQNVTFRRGLEFELKRAIDREIESKTIFRVTSDRDSADTELVTKIVSR